MRSSFPSCFSVNLIIKIVATLAANNTNSSSVKTSDERPPFPRVRVCTVFEVTEVNKAIKNLEAKLENLTTQNLKTNFKLENLTTQNLETNIKLEKISTQNLENLTTQNLETNFKLEKVNTQNLETNLKLENLSAQNLETNFKVENLSTQVNKAIRKLETRLVNLEQRTIRQNLQTNFKLQNLKTQNLETNFKLENLSKLNLETNSQLESLITQNLETNFKLEKLLELVNKTSTPQPTPPVAVLSSSCNQQYEKHRSSKSQVYELMFGSQKIPVYCHMGNFGCGGGGWTPVMKIDGTKETFHYRSYFWSDRNAHNIAGGKTGFDTQETKLPTYWNTPFSKICLGMKIGQQIKFIVINQTANCLYSLIADGKYRATSLSRNTWKSLTGSQASLQLNCNKEGFNTVCTHNAASKARIGIAANEDNDCSSCDSRIGFGTGGYQDDTNTCGNVAQHGGDNGDKHIKAMGYNKELNFP